MSTTTKATARFWVIRSSNLAHWSDLPGDYSTRLEASKAAEALEAAEPDDRVVYRATGYGD